MGGRELACQIKGEFLELPAESIKDRRQGWVCLGAISFETVERPKKLVDLSEDHSGKSF